MENIGIGNNSSNLRKLPFEISAVGFQLITLDLVGRAQLCCVQSCFFFFYGTSFGTQLCCGGLIQKQANVGTRKGRYWSTKSCFQSLMSPIFTWHTEWLSLGALRIIYQAELPKCMENIFSVQKQTLFICHQVYSFACIFHILNWHSTTFTYLTVPNREVNEAICFS